MIKIIILLVFLQLGINTKKVFAEGSKQLMSDTNSRAALSTSYESVNNNFATFSTSNSGREQDRLYIHITDPTKEIIYFGFSLPYGSSGYNTIGLGDAVTPYYMRLMDPLGNIINTPINVTTNANIGLGITGFNQVKNGPSTIFGPGGFTPITFTLPPGSVAGDYYVQFNRNSSTITSSSQVTFDYWDITVADISGGSPIAKDGRVWSYSWGFYSKDTLNGGPAFNGSFNGKLYSYTPNGFVNEIDFTNARFRGGSYRIGCNEKGPGITGDYLLDRKSIKGSRVNTKGYKVFINNPDIFIYPSGSINQGIFQYSNISCDSDSIYIFYNMAYDGQVSIFFDFDNDGIYNIGTPDLILFQNATTGTNIFVWDKKDGLGNIVSNTASIVVNVNAAIGVHHLALADVEYLEVGIIPRVIRPTLPTVFVPKLYYDDTDVRIGVGNILPLSSGVQPPSVELNGCVAPCHNWNNFTLNTTVGYGNSSTINTWWPSYAESSNHIIDLSTCFFLDLKVAYFKGEMKNCNKVILEWKLLNITNDTHLQLERSYDGTNFDEVSNIPITTALHQKFEDAISLNNNSKKIYYKLYKKERNGIKVLLKSLIINNCEQSNLSSINIFPNPSNRNTKITASFYAHKVSTIELVLNDANGKVFYRTKIFTQKGINQVKIPISAIPQGLYYIKILDSSYKNYAKKIII